MKTQQSASERYFEFLKSVSQRQRGFTNIGKLLSKSRLCSALGQVLREEKLMERKPDGVWQWIGKTPTPEMASKLVTSVNDSIKKYSKGYKASSNPVPAFPKSKSETQAKKSDILNLADLRQERSKLISRVTKIDAVLEMVAGI